ncbi:MAG: hypothetical protein L6R36_002200 [Xanthoria steineri]|nr:MAG: hypothetical protein L6R36_002200 [Xanthoria steineri]
MATQWSHNHPSAGYNRYPPQYGPQPPQNYVQQQPQHYGQQMYQPAHPPYPQQLPQQYSQSTSAQQFPQPVMHQQYPQPIPQQQYPPQATQQQYPQQPTQHQYPQHQQYDPHQQYPPQSQYDSQQQYPPQQQFSSQMQFSSQQGSQYQNHYPPIANGAYADQSQSQPTQQGCYNCGSSGHWAQACSEPKREPPAGAYNRPPPFKRQKPNPPVVTKYAVPHHVHQQHGAAPQAFGGPYAQQSYPQYQAPHGPPTPQSGQSPHQQWSQQPYQQQYQEPPLQQQYSQPKYPHQQLHHVPNAPPTPATPYATHLSNQVSPQVAKSNGVSHFANNRFQSPVGSQAQQMSSMSPVSVVAQTNAHRQQHQQQHQQHHSTNAGDAVSISRGSRNSSVSMLSMSVTPSPEPIEVTKEEIDDDLSKLDVPDIPVVTQGSFASLVDRPLPANFIVADALEPFDPPPPENNGCCQSKYTVIDKLSTFTSSIKETKYWDDIRGDPIFISRSGSSRLIPLERILATYQTRRRDEGHEPPDLEDGEWTRDTAPTVRHEGERDLMDRLEDALARPCVAEPVEVHGTNSRELKPRDDASTFSRPERSMQVRSAVHGPAGEHHWKRKIIRSIPPPPLREDSPLGSPERTPPMRSRTPSMYELNELYRQEQGVETGNGSITGDTVQASTSNGDGRNHVTYDLSDPFEPPPPPAHLRKPSSYDGAADVLQPAGSPNGQISGDGISISHGSISNGRSYSNEQSGSPSRRRSDAVNGYKREPDAALSDENNTPKRRQADDTKSKLRKRQPKVAAAYR